MPTYSTIHHNIRKIRGSARKYKCIDCGQKAHDWCWIHGTPTDDINNYEPRCGSCHGVYDGYSDRRTITEEQTLEAKRLAALGLSYREIGRRLGVKHQTISRAVNDKFVGGDNHWKTLGLSGPRDKKIGVKNG
jgi:DNA-directed RNA polymerase subunit RPC12/RpoP